MTSQTFPNWNDDQRALATAMAVFNVIAFMAAGGRVR